MQFLTIVQLKAYAGNREQPLKERSVKYLRFVKDHTDSIFYCRICVNCLSLVHVPWTIHRSNSSVIFRSSYGSKELTMYVSGADASFQVKLVYIEKRPYKECSFIKTIIPSRIS